MGNGLIYGHRMGNSAVYGKCMGTVWATVHEFCLGKHDMYGHIWAKHDMYGHCMGYGYVWAMYGMPMHAWAMYGHRTDLHTLNGLYMSKHNGWTCIGNVWDVDMYGQSTVTGCHAPAPMTDHTVLGETRDS